MVRELLAHKIINVLTKIGIIRNYIHFRNPSVSKGTKTEKRLRKMGITTEKARVNALTHLSQSLGLTMDKVENGLCEVLRWKDGCGTRFYDTIGSDQLMYLIDDKDHLRAFSITGREVEVHLPAWDRRAEGFPAGVMR